MTVVGVTGHQDLPSSALAGIEVGVREVLRTVLPPLRVVTSLAVGADQLVATEALRLGGSVDAIIPSQDYESSFTQSDTRLTFQTLLQQASSIATLDFTTASEIAYWEAGKAVVNQCDILLAVWDGQPARGLGGTADVVRYAERCGRDVRIVWPPGATRGAQQ
jgi:hypothetical protein